MSRAKCIMVQGTMSGAGKSLLCTALCRIFAQDGYRVAPFKSQNMALNSFVTRDGLEMGRAQVVQAQAAGMEPDVRMNPILLKPSSDVGSQVIVNGEVRGQMPAAAYFKLKKSLIPDILAAYDSLAEEVDIIVIEGAGSPAEINLKADDIVNMGLAELVDAPVLLAGDIDRGGVFAQLYGTVELLEPAERARIKGLIINKFRGDAAILKPGLTMLEEKTHLPVLGVVPYLRVDIEDEDSLAEQNLIVVGDRFDIQIKAIQMGVRGLIITGAYQIDPAVIEMARAKCVSVISCDYDSATTALLVRMAARANKIMRTDTLTVPPDKLLSRISESAKNSSKMFCVCSEDGLLQGVFSSLDVLDAPRQKIVLVDHNEISQAVLGAEEAEIVEIIDHHKIGSINTLNPILFVNKPVGSTCTIVSQFYARVDIKPDPRIAGLMLSGIICDTLNLKGPTATAEDAEEIARLEKIANVSANELADYIFGSTSIIGSISDADVITTDCKHYNCCGLDFSISQIEELDFSAFYKNIENIRRALEEYRVANKLSFSALFVTNVMTQDSLLMICGNSEVIEHIAYQKNDEADVYELPKIVSRKKQLVPYFMSILRNL